MKKVTRVWHGRTKASDADAFLDFLEKNGITDYKRIEGNLSAKIWRRIEGDICHFWTVTEWDSLESIRSFAGEDFQKAKYYPDAQNFLLELEEEVQHFETFEY